MTWRHWIGAALMAITLPGLVRVGGSALASARRPPEVRAGVTRIVAQPATVGWGTTTPGVSAAVHEIIRARVRDADVVVYHVRAQGFVPGQPLQVWIRRESGVVRLLTDDVTPSRSGIVVLRTDATQAFAVIAADYDKGEPLEIGVLNAAQALRAFTRVVPNP